MNKTLSKSTLEVGDLAPDFTAKIQDSTTVSLKELLSQGNKVLLIFYPGDDTPGCTAQLCGVRDIYHQYQDLGVKVFGVNPASEESHQRFIDKYDFPFDIIVDEDKSIRSKYGATKKFFANETTKRGVFLIDTDGKILFIHWGQQNNDEIISMLKQSK